MDFSNKRGMALAISTVTIMVIVLIVLVLVVSFFAGGFGEAGRGVRNILGGASGEAEQSDFQGSCKGTKSSGGLCEGTYTDNNGNTQDCSDFDDEYSECSNTDGCTWSDACSDDPDLDTKSACESEPGCYWTYTFG